MALLFISNIVPDMEKYRNSAYTRSGQNVMTGITDALSLEPDVEFVSCQPVPAFPQGPLWIKRSVDKTEKGSVIHFLPTLNILFLKNIVWGLYAFFYIVKWACRNKGLRRDILVYNIYVPIISLVYAGARCSKSRLHAILYDLGVPPENLNLGKLRMFGYRQFEKIAYKYIPLLDGRIVINDRIVKEYSPGKDYILVDGAINDDVICKLFPLKISDTQTVTYVLAGMLWEQNGTTLLLDTLKSRPDLNVKIIFAGNGNDVPGIIEAAKLDKRIEYVGMLNMEELFKVYEKADVLLNLRMEERNDMHFPSKLFEYMSVGKWIISTPVAHAERDYCEYLDFLYELTPESLAEKMDALELKTKKELLEKGERTRDFILKYRTWSKRTHEIMEYIKSKN